MLYCLLWKISFERCWKLWARTRHCIQKQNFWIGVVRKCRKTLCTTTGACATNSPKHCQSTKLSRHAWIKAAIGLAWSHFGMPRWLRCGQWSLKKTQLTPADCRWSVPAALLLKASCGTMVTPSRAARAAPMFRKLNEQTTAEAQQAGAVYVSALQYLEERGFGNIQVSPNSPWPAFCKRHYYTLPDSCLEQLAELHVHPVSFGLHLPSNNEAVRANTQVASNTGVEDAEVRFKHILCHGCGTTWTSVALVPNTGAGPGMHCKNQKMEFVFEESDVRQADAEEPAGEVTKQDARADLPIQSAPNPLTQSQEERRSAMPNFTAPRGEEVDPEDTPTAVPQEQRIYKTVFCGSPTNHITDFGSLRDEVTKILGAQRDAGVYTFSDKGLQSTTRRLTAACKPDACKECNVRVWAFSTVSANAATLVVRMSGQHGALQPPSGGMLWTMAEQHIINQISLDKLSTATLRSALKDAGLPVRALPGQPAARLRFSWKKEEPPSSTEETHYGGWAAVSYGIVSNRNCAVARKAVAPAHGLAGRSSGQQPSMCGFHLPRNDRTGPCGGKQSY